MDSLLMGSPNWVGWVERGVARVTFMVGLRVRRASSSRSGWNHLVQEGESGQVVLCTLE